MSIEKIEQALREGMEGVTPGPWMVYDGCSWRRIGTAHGRRDDCAVLAPTKASDGHPDLTCSSGNDRDANLEHIARCDPDTIRALLDELSRLREVERALRGIHDAVAKGIRENGLPNHRVHLPDGTVVEGPIADMFRNVLVAIRDVAASALSEREGQDG